MRRIQRFVVHGFIQKPSRNVHVFHVGRHRQSRRDVGRTSRETGSRSGLLHIDERIAGVEGHRRQTGTRTLRVRVDGRVRSDGSQNAGFCKFLSDFVFFLSDFVFFLSDFVIARKFYILSDM